MQWLNERIFSLAALISATVLNAEAVSVMDATPKAKSQAHIHTAYVYMYGTSTAAAAGIISNSSFRISQKSLPANLVRRP
jgi:hypothetical protein